MSVFLRSWLDRLTPTVRLEPNQQQRVDRLFYGFSAVVLEYEIDPFELQGFDREVCKIPERGVERGASLA